jgi:hypothetical protein
MEGDIFKITQHGARDLTCRYTIQGKQTRCTVG